MDKSQIPYIDLLKKDKTITLPTIFAFNDLLKLNLFLDEAKALNCKVVFENEQLVYYNDAPVDILRKFYPYVAIVENEHKIGKDYLRYLSNK